MPLTNSDPNLIEQQDVHSANNLDEKTPDYFRQEALRKIQELRAPREAIVELESNLELIMERFDFDNSYLDKAAAWYANIAWYETVGALLLMSLSGGLVGLLTISAAIAPVFALLAIGIYYAVASFLTEHYNTTTRRDDRLRDHFRQREENMTESMALLHRAEQQVEEVIISLCELNIKSADNLESFDEKNAALDIQTSNFSNSVTALKQTTNAIARDNEIINNHLGSAGIEIEQSRLDIEQGFAVVNGVINTLETNNTTLSETHDDFAHVSNEIQTHVASLARLIVGFHEQLSILKRRVAGNETLNTRASINNLMAESNDVLLRADEALDAFDEYMAEVTDNRHALNVPIRQVRTIPPVDLDEVTRSNMYPGQ